MVEASFDAGSRTGRIVLRPNRSWTWRANLWFLAAAAATLLAIAAGCAACGLWLVLPFSLLELAALATGLYCCARHTHRQEVLTFSEDELRVECGLRAPERRHVFQRLWARILVTRPRHRWHQPRVAIRSHGRELEIGAFLGYEDKRALVDELRRITEAFAAPPGGAP